MMFTKLVMNRTKRLSGQSMFEVVLALFIITMIVVAVVILSTNSVSNSVFSRSKTQAEKYSQEALEWLRSQRELSLANFNTYAATASYCLDSLSFLNTGICSSSEFINGTNFIRQVNFAMDVISVGGIDKQIINATVVTYWNDAKGYHEVRSVTEFSDPRER